MFSYIDKWLKWTCGAVSSLALFAIMWLMIIDVAGRKFFSTTIPGGIELTEILMVFVIFAALPLLSWRGEHVVFDSLDGVLPVQCRKIQAFIVHVVAAGVFTCLAFQVTKRAQRFDAYGEVTSQLKLSLGLVAWSMAGFLIVTAIVHILLLFFLNRESSFHQPQTLNSEGRDQ